VTLFFSRRIISSETEDRQSDTIAVCVGCDLGDGHRRLSGSHAQNAKRSTISADAAPISANYVMVALCHGDQTPAV
jgi:hypothetical protein